MYGLMLKKPLYANLKKPLQSGFFPTIKKIGQLELHFLIVFFWTPIGHTSGVACHDKRVPTFFEGLISEDV